MCTTKRAIPEDLGEEYDLVVVGGGLSGLLTELGVDIDRLLERNDFNYGDDGELGPATYFDAEIYGRDVLIPGFTPRWGDFASILGKLDAGAYAMTHVAIDEAWRTVSELQK